MHGGLKPTSADANNEAARTLTAMSEGGPPAPPPCIILDLPDAIVELVLSQLTPWDCGNATGACKAFHSHARGVAAVRAARLGITLPRPLADEPVLRMLHVVESVAGWVFEVLDEDPLGNTDPWLKLEHRPSGACINFCGNSNGWLECLRRSGSEWETAWTAGPIETDESVVGSINDDAGHPLHDFQLLRKLSTWCEEPRGGDGNWRFSLCPSGVLVSTTHSDYPVEPTLLNAQGGMVHMSTHVGVGADFVMYVDAVEYGPDVDY